MEVTTKTDVSERDIIASIPLIYTSFTTPTFWGKGIWVGVENTYGTRNHTGGKLPSTRGIDVIIAQGETFAKIPLDTFLADLTFFNKLDNDKCKFVVEIGSAKYHTTDPVKLEGYKISRVSILETKVPNSNKDDIIEVETKDYRITTSLTALTNTAKLLTYPVTVKHKGVEYHFTDSLLLLKHIEQLVK